MHFEDATINYVIPFEHKVFKIFTLVVDQNVKVYLKGLGAYVMSWDQLKANS